MGVSLWAGAPPSAQLGVLVAFVGAFFARWRLDDDPAGWMRANWIDLLLVVVLASPLLRMLGMLRLVGVAPALRIGALVRAHRAQLLRLVLWSTESWPAALAVGLGVVFVFGAVEFAIEHPHNPAFGRFEDGLWWALATVTTVGYGDIAPVTSAGRLVAALTMIFGIAAYSLLIANLTVQLERMLERRRRPAEGDE